jgi:aspartokinase/homoserine dehydrogenase 1
MKVLKFGGSSVANAENIEKVIEIIRDAVRDDNCAVVLSAMYTTTDSLIEAGRIAAAGDDGFFEKLKRIEEIHETALEQLFTEVSRVDISEFFESTIKELENICEGVRLVRELSDKTLDRILSFGELMSSRMVAAKLGTVGLENEWIDSRLLIRTDSRHGSAAVNFAETNKGIAEHFERSKAGLHILPGFIASDADGYTTTLGRGGSDFTAAIIAFRPRRKGARNLDRRQRYDDCRPAVCS